MLDLTLHEIVKCVIFSGDYEITAGSCMTVKLIALRPGFTTLTVSYEYGDIILKAAVTVGSYLPLKVSRGYIELKKQFSKHIDRVVFTYQR